MKASDKSSWASRILRLQIDRVKRVWQCHIAEREGYKTAISLLYFQGDISLKYVLATNSRKAILKHNTSMTG
jgi:hypothetical protein